MVDELANDWGCDLICISHNIGRKHNIGAVIDILADDQRQGNFYNLIDQMTVVYLD